jgi:phosphate starvation-inducible PhoH-like protein
VTTPENNLAKRPSTRNGKIKGAYDAEVDPRGVTPISRPRRAFGLSPRTDAQGNYMANIDAGDLIYGLGPAGTGKTFIAVAMAAMALMNKDIKKIILTRPVIEVGQGMGFLPGELEEKYEPYLKPVRQTLIEVMGRGQYEYALKAGQIEPAPLGFMRGDTFNDCWVILDEAQNVTPTEMKMFLTRAGENCKVLICGDSDQVDIQGPSGLDDAVKRTAWIPCVRITEFTVDDVVRSGLCQDVLKSYSKNRD